MRLKTLLFSTLFALGYCGTAFSENAKPFPFEPFAIAQNYQCGKTCKYMRSCKEAVYQWCACGYSGADRDNDGVPCESLCGQSTSSNLQRVRAFKSEFGCR